MAVKQASWNGLRCPKDRSHGVLVEIAMPDGSSRYHCPHWSHQDARFGRKAEQHTFTLAEAEKGLVAA
jgi:hypothetical protein